MNTDPQQTATFRDAAPTAAEPPRARVALVAGSGGGREEDLYPLLRRRLRVAATLLAALFLISTVLNLWAWLGGTIGFDRTFDGFVELAVWQWQSLLVTAIETAAAVWLWRSPPRAVRGLRVIELTVFGSVFGGLLVTGLNADAFSELSASSHDSADARLVAVRAHTSLEMARWFAFLVTYGVLIPNTGRRAVIVCAAFGLAPLVGFAALGLGVHRLEPSVVTHVLSRWGFYIGWAVAVVGFGSSRLERLRQQADEARKLGQYVLREKLGAGGMGEVYRAEHALLRRPCALKLIRPERAGDPDTLRRFEREVQTTATLTHPNTVQVFDYGHTADGTFYYVMEYLPGLTLDDVVRRSGPLPPGRAVHFLRQVCGALGEAHARGLTHRDIKPGNVMVCERGGVRDVAKLLDFGLVRAPQEGDDGGTLTREGTVAGTPAYMSPEQAGGQAGIDPRSDIYGVGAVAYFLLAGRPPFADRSAVRMLAAHLYEAPPPLPGHVPSDLAAVVMRCLAKNPADRYPDAASLDAALGGTSAEPWTANDAEAWWRGLPGPDGLAGAELPTATHAAPNPSSATTTRPSP